MLGEVQSEIKKQRSNGNATMLMRRPAASAQSAMLMRRPAASAQVANAKKKARGAPQEMSQAEEVIDKEAGVIANNKRTSKASSSKDQKRDFKQAKAKEAATAQPVTIFD